MPTSLLHRRLYVYADVDRLLRLPHGTARRWIDGYNRAGVQYQPVIRPERTGDDAVTWGEFVETRLLAEFRARGATLQRLRPAVLRLRDEFGEYPLAHAKPFLDVAGRELVRRVQDEVGISGLELLVVVRSDQLMISPAVQSFVNDVRYADNNGGAHAGALVPLRFGGEVTFDPLRQNGRPVVRSVPTEVIAEQFRAGESADSIASLFDLTREQVEQALRFELSLAETA